MEDIKLSTDDLFNEARDTRTAAEKIDTTETTVRDWFKHDSKSFTQCCGNMITDVRGEKYGTELEYDLTKSLSEPKVFIVNYNTVPKQTVTINVASIRSLGFIVNDIAPKKETPEAQGLMIYGHVEDYDNKFDSRIDSELMMSISKNIPHKFNKVYLSGAFKSIEDLKTVIMHVYENMTTKIHIAKVVVCLDSMVRDDERKPRTIADLIHAGYIPSSIVYNPNIVEFRYKRLDPMYTAELYTKRLVSKSEENPELEMSSE